MTLAQWVAAIVCGFAGVTVAIALVEQARSLIRRPSPPTEIPEIVPPGISALRAQKIYNRLLYMIAPALVAGALVQVRQDRIAVSLAVVGSFMAASLILHRSHAPLHLMPVARVVLRVATPALGAVIAVLPDLISPWALRPGDLVAPLLAAEAIVGLASLLEMKFKTSTPVRLAILGSADLARKLSRELEAANVRGYRVEGFLVIDEEIDPRAAVADPPCLGSLDDVRTVVGTHGIDLLAVGPKGPRLKVFEQAALACLDLPVRMIEANALYEEVLGHVPIGAVNSAWFQAIMHPRYTPTSPFTKRVIDLMIALPAAVLVVAPLTPLIAFLIKRNDGGSVFYRQPRVGEQGRVFSILKFRSMTEGALEQRDFVPKEQLITPVGRFLRRTHLDELPQLFNVVKGEMSIVGPRPEQPDLVRGLEEVLPYYERRSLIKPGLTGWAQVRCGYAGTHIGTAWKLCHDLFYLKRRSLFLDLLIIVQTFHILFEATEQELTAPAEDFILGEAAAALPKQPA